MEIDSRESQKDAVTSNRDDEARGVDNEESEVETTKDYSPPRGEDEELESVTIRVVGVVVITAIVSLVRLTLRTATPAVIDGGNGRLTC